MTWQDHKVEEVATDLEKVQKVRGRGRTGAVGGGFVNIIHI